MSPRAHNPAARWTTCEKCGHRGYHTRGDAKAVRKRHHGAKGMAVFACPHTEGLFHVGHRPNALSSGQIDRNLLRVQALKSATATQDFSIGLVSTCPAQLTSSFESQSGPAIAAEPITAATEARRLERTRRMRTAPLCPCTPTASDQNRETTE